MYKKCSITTWGRMKMAAMAMTAKVIMVGVSGVHFIAEIYNPPLPNLTSIHFKQVNNVKYLITNFSDNKN
jgi:hypothetical protein